MPITDLWPSGLWPGFSYKRHQTTAVEWMLSREDQKPESGGLLCDEMGLGKTMEVLGTIKNSKKSQTLLLCPKAVIDQWLIAGKKSNLNCMLMEGEGWRFTTTFKPGQPFLFITNYEKLTSKTKRPFRRCWDRIVLDEAHRAKNSGGNLWNAINALDRKTLWCVTATPVINDLKDIHNLFALVGYKKDSLTNYEYLTTVMSEACLHRSMEMMRPVLKELPATPLITKQVLDFTTEEEQEFYRGIQGSIVRRWKALEHDNIMVRLALLVRLRQLSVHPQVYINARRSAWAGYERDDWVEASTKFVALRKKLEEPLHAPGQDPTRWIIFCQFREEMKLLESYLSSSPAVESVLLYHGGLNDAQKREILKKTTAQLGEKHQILLLQLQSGGVGLNLQHFSKIVFMSPWWTAAMMDQAIGRAVRIGQEKIVEVTMLVLNEEDTMNIDIEMLEKAEGKRGLMERLFLHANHTIDEHANLRIRIPADKAGERELTMEILKEHFDKIHAT
jgi:SNF2 family DNA or RNA helicase